MKNPTIVRIKNLKLKTIIGINPQERVTKQEVVINVEIETDARKAIKKDEIQYALDYKVITKKIISEVEKTNFFLLEKLADYILQLVLKFKGARKVTVEVDKPLALRYADSVSVTVTAKKQR